MQGEKIRRREEKGAQEEGDRRMRKRDLVLRENDFSLLGFPLIFTLEIVVSRVARDLGLLLLRVD